MSVLRRADQWSDTLREKLNLPDVFRELHNALLGKKNNRKKTPVSQILSRIDSYITSEGSLKGPHVSTRLVQIRLLNADSEAFDQYTSISHILKWVQSATIKKFNEFKIMLALRFLRADDWIKKEEPPIPRPDEKKKGNTPKNRRTSREMINYWKGCDQGRYSLVHEMSTPKDNVHTVRAVPQVINDLENKDKTSLSTLARWAYEYYEKTNLNIRQIIDGDILQVLNGIHLSGLLLQIGEVEEVLSVSDTDDNQDKNKAEDEESTPAGNTNDSDKESDKEESEDAEGDSTGSE